jgi:hypothetical protein
MRYAIIKNTICANIIKAEPEFAQKIGAVEIPDGYGIGDRYIDGVWEKGEVPKSDPTAEERLSALESAMLVMMEG